MKHAVQSLLNGIFFKLRSCLRWSRKGYREIPVRNISDYTKLQKLRRDELCEKYDVRFESFFRKEHALENYHYLNLLDEIWNTDSLSPSGRGLGRGGDLSVLDVGSKNFCYSHALSVFFKPASLTGIEVDAYKIYDDFHSRFDYAQHFVSTLPNATYLAQDFLDYQGEANVITCFYPFVMLEPLLNWTLPPSLFKPELIFGHFNTVLKKDGLLVLASQGNAEFDGTSALAKAAGFQLVSSKAIKNHFINVNDQPIASIWAKDML